jgi:hypothetical protein
VKANYRRIEKGSVIGNDWYYVVVSTHAYDGKMYLYCLCDNANNIYSFTMDEVLGEDWLILSPLKAMHIYSYSSLDLTKKDEELFHKINREIPATVIAEVLSGQEDKRFDHWYGDE